MKWYDWYFLAWALLFATAGATGAVYTREYSIIGAIFSLTIGFLLAIGAIVQWGLFRKHSKL